MCTSEKEEVIEHKSAVQKLRIISLFISFLFIPIIGTHLILALLSFALWLFVLPILMGLFFRKRLIEIAKYCESIDTKKKRAWYARKQLLFLILECVVITSLPPLLTSMMMEYGGIIMQNEISSKGGILTLDFLLITSFVFSVFLFFPAFFLSLRPYRGVLDHCYTEGKWSSAELTSLNRNFRYLRSWFLTTPFLFMSFVFPGVAFVLALSKYNEFVEYYFNIPLIFVFLFIYLWPFLSVISLQQSVRDPTIV